MPLSEILGNYINNIFSGKYLVSNESDFKMLLEHELLKDFDSSRISTEYEYHYRHGNHEMSLTDIIVWNDRTPTIIDYAIEVKYIITGGFDLHGNDITGHGSQLEEFELDLMKIRHLVDSKTAEHGYAIYITDSLYYKTNALKEIVGKEFSYCEDVIDNVDNGIVGESPISLYLLIAYK